MGVAGVVGLERCAPKADALRDKLPPGAIGLQSLLLKIDVSKIVIHKAAQRAMVGHR